MSTVTMRRSMRFVRGWVHTYTAGLQPAVRDARREEIEADLWEQSKEAVLLNRSQSELSSNVLLRWILGIPDDVVWRVGQLRKGNDSGTKETAMVESSTSRTMAFGIGGLALVLLAAALAWTVIHQIDRAQADYDWTGSTWWVAWVIQPLVIGFIVGGFRIMRRAPSLGVFLVVVASAASAVTLFWLIIPPLVAIAVSVYAIRRARRLQRQG